MVKNNVSKFFFIPQRFIVAIMSFWAMVIMYATRIALSFVITKMVAKNISTTNVTSTNECIDDILLVKSIQNYNEIPAEISNGIEDQFDWSEQLQGVILSAFYIGFILLQVPGGMLSSYFGGKYVLLIAVAINGLFTLLTPVCVHMYGAPALILFRIIIGAAEGTFVPAIFELLSSWFPMRERTRSTSFSISGMQIGCIIGATLSGYLLSEFEGWSIVYYVYGTAAVVWCIFFFLLCYNKPESHPFIGDMEKNYLKSEIKSKQEDKAPIPWHAILLSSKVWIIIVAQLSFNFAFYIMNINLAKYMSDVLKFPMLKNGLLCALPYFLYWIVNQVSGILADFLINKYYLSITNTRKMFAIICIVIPPIFMLAASYAECNKMLAVTFFVLGAGFMGSFSSGVSVNCLDLSPNYGSILISFTNAFGLLGGFLAPYMTSYFTPNGLLMEWRQLFWFNFTISIPSAISVILWTCGEIQPWNSPEILKATEKSEKCQTNKKF